MIRRPPRSTLFPHDALPISFELSSQAHKPMVRSGPVPAKRICSFDHRTISRRSEEHTSELQSHSDLVCRLLLEKKKKTKKKKQRNTNKHTLTEYCKTMNQCE